MSINPYITMSDSYTQITSLERQNPYRNGFWRSFCEMVISLDGSWGVRPLGSSLLLTTRITRGCCS